MKNSVGGFTKSVYKAVLNLILNSQLLEQKAFSITAVRLVSVFLITALLSPVFLFSPIWKTAARTNLPFQSPAPISAPPEPFVLGSAQSTVSSSIVSSLFSVKEFFSPEQLPVGFENAKVPTISERMASSLGTTFGSIFGITDSSSKKSNESSDSSNPFNSSSSSSSSTPSTNLLFGQYSSGVDFDFDGDGKADIARWHASNTEWKIKKSSNGNYQTETIGSGSSIIAPGDYDGDGKTDVAVFNAGTWTIKNSSTNSTITGSFGTSGDKPVVGDYDGDGSSDLAIFRPSTNTWWILYSSNLSYTSTQFGSAGDIPVQGKFDADTKTDIAFFRPSTGDWHVQGSTAGYYTFHWGASTDIPVPADYDGDGYSDFAVYRGTTGTWYVSKSSTANASYQAQVWGNYGDQPTPADYDGDGKADYSIWRPTTGMWYTIKSDGNVYDYQTLGVSGDTAVSSAYLKQIGGYIYSYDFAKVRLSPKNSTGGTDLYSRNFSWGTGLVGLSGRAGLDAGFGISYNSLIWTKDPTNNAIVFDADNSNLTPGFRFGFPTIEPVYYDAQTGKFAYLMVEPSGSRTEFRQTAASGVYETGDSSYTQLKINDNGSPDAPADSLSITVTNTSGTNMLYEWKNGVYRCQKITDRNGNYISINHDTNGQLQTVTDTLGRIITVNYNSEGLPGSITQTWKDTNGEGSNITHTYAAFTYTTKQIYTNFSGSPTVVGPGDGYSLKVLQKITFPTETNGAGPNTVFTYNTWGQVTQVTNYAADNHQLNYTKVNLPADATNSQSDCPRFTETRSWVENFNLDQYNSPQESVITNSITENASYSLPGSISGTATKIEVSMTNHPQGAVSKTFVGSSGWMEGLPIATEDWANGTSSSERKRWTWANWTQDDTNLSYIQNPRVTESKVGDTTNIKKTKTYYEMQGSSTTIANYGRVNKVEVYAADGTTVWKQGETSYNNNSAYISRRMIGLPSTVKVSGFDQSDSQLKLVSMMTYAYDDEDDFGDTNLEQNITSVIKHDNNFSSGFIVGRGNLTGTKRCDVSISTNCSSGITSSIKYNIAGGIVAQISPAPNNSTRTIKISYADKFNDTTTNRNTYAYPTKIYDSADNYSEVKYRFDIGANVWAQSPAPQNQIYGKTTKRNFDDYGRLQKESLLTDVQGTLQEYSYTRYDYPTNNIQSKIYSTIVDTDANGIGNTADEVLTESWTDGAGRARMTRTPMSWNGQGNTATWSGQIIEYNILGQVKRQSVPSEIDSNWALVGDDATRNTWLWSSQEYDWKGRVIRSIPTDSNGSDGKDQIISYDGCGCAGGQVTTIKGASVPVPGQSYSARRTQKVYEDILGRTYKTEMMNWDELTPYITSEEVFDGRDQIVSNKQYDGASTGNYCPTGTCQETTQTFDGYGRLSSKHFPQQDTGTSTSYTYNTDDSTQSKTDARGAATNYTYNSRGLVSNVSYSIPNNSNITVPSAVNFDYDAAGNRTWMTDGLGRVDYEYDGLSRLKNEVRQFSDSLPQAPESNNRYRLSYTYNLAGHLSSLTDPFSATIYYARDKIGRLSSVTGTSYGGVTNYAGNAQYRAWGALKHLEYGTQQQMNMTFNSKLKADSFELSYNGQAQMQKEYQYYSDGNLSYMQDLLNPKFDRLNKYDHLGRVLEAYTGAETRGQTESNLQNQPYRQTYNYDTFGNLLHRVNKNWGTDYSSPTFSYINNREQNISTYDADGQLLRGAGWLYERDIVTAGGAISKKLSDDIYNVNVFDAAGRLDYSKEMRDRTYYDYNTSQTTPTDTWESGRKIQKYDGDGLPIKSGGWYIYETVDDFREQVASHNIYYIRSSVLKGEIVTTVKGSSGNTDSGKKYATNVYADGTILAHQTVFNTNAIVDWEIKDASGASTGGEERDPSGGDVGLSYESTLPPPPPPPDAGRPSGGFGFDWEQYYPNSVPGGSYDGLRNRVCVVDSVPGYRCDIEFHNIIMGNSTLDTRLNQRHLLAQFGMVEQKRRDPIYALSPVYKEDGNSVKIDGVTTKFEDRGSYVMEMQVVGYNAEFNWELTNLVNDFVFKTLDRFSESVLFKDMKAANRALTSFLNYDKCKEKVESLFRNLKQKNKNLGYDNEVLSTDVLTLFDKLNSQAKGGIRINSSQEAANKDFIEGGYKGDPISGGLGLTWVSPKGSTFGTGAYAYVHILTASLSTQSLSNITRNASPETINDRRMATAYNLVITLIHEIAHGSGNNATFSHDEMDIAAKAVDPKATSFDNFLKTNCVPEKYR